MKKLTKKEVVEHHREMWRWIALETKKQRRKVEKSEYFEAKKIRESKRPYHDNYCCEFIKQQWEQHYDCHYCDNCPINWGIGFDPGYRGLLVPCTVIAYITNEEANKDGYYARWSKEKNPEKAAALAEYIAELPERKESIDGSNQRWYDWQIWR